MVAAARGESPWRRWWGGGGGGFDTVKTEITWRLPKARRWRVNEYVELFLDVAWPCHARADDVAALLTVTRQHCRRVVSCRRAVSDDLPACRHRPRIYRPICVTIAPPLAPVGIRRALPKSPDSRFYEGRGGTGVFTSAYQREPTELIVFRYLKLQKCCPVKLF